jgi:surfeit locus 1 family protein
MRRAGWRFGPRPVPTLAAAAMVALTLWLAAWQAGRAGEKQERQAMLEARVREPVVELTGALASAESVLFRRVRARGSYLAEGQIFVDNRQHAGRAGFHVLTPLRLQSGVAVLVLRGWAARTSAYPAPPEAPVPGGPVTVEGLASVPPARFVELSSQTVSGAVWQNLSIEKYRERMRIDVLPVIVLAAAPGAGMTAVVEKPDAGVEKHQEYALTWLALAVTTAVLWVALNLRRAA